MNNLVAAFFAAILLILTTACEVPEDDGKTAADRADVNNKKKDKGKADEPKEDSGPKETVAQANAREAAESYLDLSPFSRSGLIEQLEFEDYSTKDATYGVDAQNADWNKQAAASAQSYLDLTSYSRAGLIEQLVFEGYTQEQATYGVNQVGL